MHFLLINLNNENPPKKGQLGYSRNCQLFCRIAHFTAENFLRLYAVKYTRSYGPSELNFIRKMMNEKSKKEKTNFLNQQYKTIIECLVGGLSLETEIHIKPSIIILDTSFSTFPTSYHSLNKDNSSIIIQVTYTNLLSSACPILKRRFPK